MSNYDTLLIELLNRLDKKADRLISLLEVSQHAKDGCDNGADTSNDSPDCL